MATTTNLTAFGNNPSTQTTSTYGTTSPAAGTSESWTVTTASGFPATQTVFPTIGFHIVDPALPSELILVTVVSGTSWTVTRGVEGTTPVAHATGATFYQTVSAGDLSNFKQTPGMAASAVTVTSNATLTVMASYTPVGSDLVAGTCYESIAFGTFVTNYATARMVMTWGLYWGGSGTVGGTYTPGTALCKVITGTNAVALATTTSVAGSTFDVNGSMTYLSSTTATANINLFYTNSSNSLIAAQNNATATNATTGAASSVTPVAISGGGPLFLVFEWTSSSGTPATQTLTATAPVIYRMA